MADGCPVGLGGGRLRALLARLAIDANQVVSTETLIRDVWGEAAPAGAANALQSLVSRLRRAIPGCVGSEPAGYRLTIAPEQVDALEFERRVRDGRRALAQGRVAAGADELRHALRLWRGPALVDIGDAAFTAGAASRLEELRLGAVEDRLDAELRLDRYAEALAELPALCSAHPLRERLRGLLIRALYGAGRQAEALAAYEDLRTRLADELGVDPSPELRQLHVAVLRGEAATRPVPSIVDERPRLRTALTSFVGRDAEVARLTRLLGECRLVTLVGTGGAGKTRLAVECATGVPEPVWFVELAPVRDAGDVTQAILNVLGPRDLALRDAAAGARDTGERVLDLLRDRRALLVLDNCEHLVEACARLVETVLGECPGVRILATSREPLGISGEMLLPVGPLAVPPAGATAARALEFPAVRLFADRAAGVDPDFAIDETTVDPVIEICRRLDGLPLAIELATARLRTLPVAHLAAGLGDRFRLLTGGSRTALPRHQTLSAVVDWSWHLLDEAERALARRMAVFAGDPTLEAIETVCAGAGLPREAVLDRLGALVDKSLVALAPGSGEPRYRMLETIRVYAVQRLAEADEASTTRTAHAAAMLALAEAADPMLRTAAQVEWLARLERERDDLVAAAHWAAASGDAETALRMTAALGWYFVLRGDHSEAVAWASEALEVPGDAPPLVRCLATGQCAVHSLAVGQRDRTEALFAETERLREELATAGITDWRVDLASLICSLFVDDHVTATAQAAALSHNPESWVRGIATFLSGALAANGGEATAGEERFAAALELFRDSGDRWGMAMSLTALVESHSHRGEHAAALAAIEEALGLVEELGSDEDAASMRVRRALERIRMGDLDSAAGELESSLTWADGAGRVGCEVYARAALAELARRRGQLAEARLQIDKSIERFTVGRHGPAQILGIMQVGLGWIQSTGGDVEGARAAHLDGMRTAFDVLDWPILAMALEGLADIALASGDAAEGARLLGLATAVRGEPDLGNPEVVRMMAECRRRLGDAEYDRGYSACAGMTPDHASKLARELVG
jgi:predicted ATPase/DNA-binding SARP family transcriptional activator